MGFAFMISHASSSSTSRAFQELEARRSRICNCRLSMRESRLPMTRAMITPEAMREKNSAFMLRIPIASISSKESVMKAKSSERSEERRGGKEGRSGGDKRDDREQS